MIIQNWNHKVRQGGHASMLMGVARSWVRGRDEIHVLLPWG